MKKISLISRAVFLTFLVLFLYSFSLSEDYRISIDDSIVNWKAEKVGGEHYGEIQISSGKLQIEDGQLIGGSIQMNMQSIVITDIKNKKNNAKLQKVLESQSFFNVKEFPSASFKISQVIAKSDNEFFVNGDLQIKDINNRISFTTLIADNGDKSFTAMGEIVIDRTDYDIRYDNDGFFDALGDKIIYDEFTINFVVYAVPR